MKVKNSWAVPTVVAVLSFWCGTRYPSPLSKEKAGEASPQPAALPSRVTATEPDALPQQPPPAPLPASQTPAPASSPHALKRPRAAEQLSRQQRQRLYQTTRYESAGAEVEQLSARIDELEKESGLQRTRHEFDLDESDWQQLGEQGTYKVRLPCVHPKRNPERMRHAGLQPEDDDLVRAAQSRSNDRVWGILRPLCARASGSEEAARAMGPNACKHKIRSCCVESFRLRSKPRSSSSRSAHTNAT